MFFDKFHPAVKRKLKRVCGHTMLENIARTPYVVIVVPCSKIAMTPTITAHIITHTHAIPHPGQQVKFRMRWTPRLCVSTLGRRTARSNVPWVDRPVRWPGRVAYQLARPLGIPSSPSIDILVRWVETGCRRTPRWRVGHLLCSHLKCAVQLLKVPSIGSLPSGKSTS